MATSVANEVLTNLAFGKSFETIKDDMFNVAVAPILLPQGYDFTNEVYNNVLDVKNQKVLGVVKKLYNPLQQQIMIDNMLETAKALKISEDNLSYSIDDNGRKFRIRLALRPIEFINNVKKGETIQTYLNLQTGYDGNTPTSIFVETLRLACTNGMKMQQTELAVNVRNIASNEGKILDLMQVLPKAMQSVENVRDIFMNYDKAQVTTKQVQEFFNRLDAEKFGDKAQEKHSALKRPSKDSAFVQFQQSINTEFARTGATKFGLLNVVTHYTNHIARNSQVNGMHNVNAIYNGGSNKLNNKALEILETL